MNYQTILTTSCTDSTSCFSKRAIVQQYASTILMKKIFFLQGTVYSIHMFISMQSDISSSVVRIPNTEYGKRNYIFRWEFMLILICD